MSIHEDAKKILEYMLDTVINSGNYHHKFYLDYKKLAKSLDFENEKYCKICFQYLNELGYIKIVEKPNVKGVIEKIAQSKNIEAFKGDTAQILAKGIKYFESYD